MLITAKLCGLWLIFKVVSSLWTTHKADKTGALLGHQFLELSPCAGPVCPPPLPSTEDVFVQLPLRKVNSYLNVNRF